jgi:hypothetical protein
MELVASVSVSASGWVALGGDSMGKDGERRSAGVSVSASGRVALSGVIERRGGLELEIADEIWS